MKRIFLFIASILMLNSLQAQLEEDALRFSSFGLNGTANYISKAGAIGALGGDITSASYNPAGLGLFSSSEFSMSLGYFGSFTESISAGNKLNENRSNMNFGGIGAVFNFGNPNGNFKNTQFTYALNRLKSFGNRTVYERDNVASSYISYIIDNYSYDKVFMHDFFESYVLDYDTTLGVYTSAFQTGNFSQIRTFTESGTINEMTFSLSTNYQDLLYLGATIGVPIAEYHRHLSFSESKLDVNGKPTNTYIYNETYDLFASGVNFKAGLIAKPVQFLRLGVAVHTPTFYSIEDKLYSEVDYERVVGGSWKPIIYDLHTPFRFLGSAALVFGEKDSPIKGTLSADYEYANYSYMKFRRNTIQDLGLNRSIESMFRATNTFRVAGELKIGNLALRAGYANMGNPYEKSINDDSREYFTGGIGIRNKHFLLDFAYAYSTGNSFYTEYDYERIELNNSRHIAQVTLGFRF